MTTRGFRPEDFRRVAEIIHQAVTITQKVDKDAISKAKDNGRKNPTSVAAFKEYLGEGEEISDIVQLRKEVEDWVGTFKLPWIKDS